MKPEDVNKQSIKRDETSRKNTYNARKYPLTLFLKVLLTRMQLDIW